MMIVLAHITPEMREAALGLLIAGGLVALEVALILGGCRLHDWLKARKYRKGR